MYARIHFIRRCLIILIAVVSFSILVAQFQLQVQFFGSDLQNVIEKRNSFLISPRSDKFPSTRTGTINVEITWLILRMLYYLNFPC